MTDIYTPGSGFKGRVLAGLSLVFILGLIVTMAVLYFTMLEPIGPSYGMGVDMLSGMRQEIFHRALIVFGITFLVMALGIIILAMFYSHRIAGPLYRLTQFVRQLAGGRFDARVKLREKDVIHPIAEEINEMVEEYQHNFREIKQEIDSLESLAVGLENNPDDLGKIRVKAEKIHDMTDKYRLGS